jgi:hypothetical protein
MYRFEWQTRGDALLKASLHEHPAPGTPRTLTERIIRGDHRTIRLYELLNVTDEAVVSFEVQWVDGPSSPVRGDASLNLASTVRLRPHDQLGIGEAIQKAWQRLVSRAQKGYDGAR